jgi:hypothetical protein
MPPQPPAQVAPVTSEAFAEEAKIEIKPEQAAETAPAAEKTSQAVEDAASEKVLPAPEKAGRAGNAGARDRGSAKDVARPVRICRRKSHRWQSGCGRCVARQRRDARDVFVRDGDARGAADTVAGVRSTWPIDVDSVRAKAGATIGDVSRLPLEKGQAIRFVSIARRCPRRDDCASGESWTPTFADRANAAAAADGDPQHHRSCLLMSQAAGEPRPLHRLVDPDAGDILVVTALPLDRGFIKRQDFVELSLLESVHAWWFIRT